MHTRFGRSDGGEQLKEQRNISEEGQVDAKEYSIIKTLVEDINNNDKSAPQKLASHLSKRTSSWRDALRLLHRNKFKLGTIALVLVALYFLIGRKNALVKHLNQDQTDWLLSELKKQDWSLHLKPTELYKQAERIAKKWQEMDPSLSTQAIKGLGQRTNFRKALMVLFESLERFFEMARD